MSAAAARRALSESALRALDRRGAHLVRCRGDKTPEGPWRHPAPIARVVEHDARGGMTGVVPGSIHSVVVDHDVVGDWSKTQLPLFDPPIVRLETPNGLHDWFDKRDPAETVRNRKWEIGDSSGDIRGDKGYVCLHGDAAERLTRALDTRGAHERRLFPADLFAAADIVLERRLPPKAVIEGDAEAAGDYARARRDAADVQIGQRNCWLFDTVRVWAYRRRKDFWRYEHWKAEVRHRAYEIASGLSAPLPAHEIESTARSVAGWCFVNLPPRVAARKGAHAAAAVKRAKSLERDRAIVAALRGGGSLRRVAAAFGMSPEGVRKVFKRMTAIDDEPPLRL